MIRIAISYFALTLTATSLVAEARLAASNATAPTEAVNWTAGVNYTYDASGNVTVIGKENFRYDQTDRLVQAEVSGVTRVYTYDAFGNRTGCMHAPDKAEESDCQFGIGIDGESNRVNGVDYDSVGNVEQYSGHTYSYDALNMPIRDDRGAGGAREFVYTADDERIAIHTVGSTWNWTIREVTGKVLREFTSKGASSFTWARDYVYRDGQLLASVHPAQTSSVTYHYHLDHLGTPRRVTDRNNRIVGFHDYFAFGPEVSGGLTEPNAASLQYTGHERDKWGVEGFDTLDYMHARYYSPTMGRFLSVDPETESAELTMPQSWSRYSYVLNNPMRYIDPTGRVVRCVPADKEGDPPICSEVIEVEGEEPEVEPEPKQAGMLPFLTGMWDSVQHETENLKHLTADDFSFDHAPKVDFGQCIEDNSFSNVYTAAGTSANALLNKAVGDTTRTGISGIPTHPTTWQNKAGRVLARQARRAGVPGLYHKVHRFGRFAGRAAVVLTVFEGFYDIGTIGRCGALAASR